MPSGDNTAKQDEVRELQVKLYLAAKRSPQRRFHALWDRIHRRDVLQRAWQQVRAAVEAVVAERVRATQRNEQLLAEISQINLELLRRRALG